MQNSDYKILIVDDEQDILEFVGYSLKKEGFNVLKADNGNTAIQIAKKELPHLIILDIMMPDLDGIETCRQMKRHNELRETIITFFSARNEDFSQIAGFDAGADDYITKPIKPRLLLSKVTSLLRRHTANTKSSPDTIEINNLIINKERYTVTYKNKEMTLPKKEFELLYLLTSRPNKVFTRQDIYSKIWDDNVLVGERTIDVHIRKLREKLDNIKIVTIKGVGYKFETE